jgi:hypothetical protein
VFIQYYVTNYSIGNNGGGFFMRDSHGCHGVYICPSECQWAVPGTLDPNE